MNNILDQRYFDNKEIKSALVKGGINRFFELENGKIVVQKNDFIQVGIQLENGQVKVKPKFPQIGNPVQIVATILLLAGGYFLSLPFPWVIAIVGGQLISLGWYFPKIKVLQADVNQALG